MQSILGLWMAGSIGSAPRKSDMGYASGTTTARFANTMKWADGVHRGQQRKLRGLAPDNDSAVAEEPQRVDGVTVDSDLEVQMASG